MFGERIGVPELLVLLLVLVNDSQPTTHSVALAEQKQHSTLIDMHGASSAFSQQINFDWPRKLLLHISLQ
jgi:hypothetical protein